MSGTSTLDAPASGPRPVVADGRLRPLAAASLAVAAVIVTPWSIPLEHGIAAAAWVAPILLLALVRGLGGRGLIAVAALLVASVAIASDDFVTGGTRVGFALLFGLAMAAPYAVDAALHRHLRASLRSLVFPLALTAVDTLLARVSPMGTWALPEFAHVDELVFVQLAALTGAAGLTFAVGWTASVAVEVIGDLYARRTLPRVAFAWLAMAIAVAAWGSIRLATAPPANQTIRIAGVTRNEKGAGPPPPYEQIDKMTDAERAALRPGFEAGVALLSERTRREAASGAQIVVWNEAAALTLVQDEGAMLAKAAALARETHVYLLATYMSILQSDRMPFVKNRTAMFSPQGEALFDYPKSHPIPGNPYDSAVPGGAPVPVIDTPLGRLATVICFDMDFPALVAQVGRARAQVLLVPAFDWDGIRTIHSRMARLRAVEQGVSLFRITDHAQSVASDPYGRIVATMDDDNGANDGTMIAMLPVGRAFVTAPWIVDWIAPLSVAALFGLAMCGWVTRRKRLG
jgi:apolipoprotein N-acyltransferase